MVQSNKNPDWIHWQSSAAREIILEDLLPNGRLAELKIVPTEHLLQLYKEWEPIAFERVVFSQFEARLKDHLNDAAVRMEKAKRKDSWLEHDRKLYPR